MRSQAIDRNHDASTSKLPLRPLVSSRRELRRRRTTLRAGSLRVSLGVLLALCLAGQCSAATAPPWICPCHEKAWREHWDPAHAPTFVDVTVALAYGVNDFHDDHQKQLASVIAHVAAVENEDWRVAISSVAEASGGIAVAVRIRVPPFEAVPVADRAVSIRDALTLEQINQQRALEPDSLEAITAVLVAAAIIKDRKSVV